MRPETFRAHDLRRFFERYTIATLAELKKALGTDVDSTVFRKLGELAYRSSYSHRGSYYTLDELAGFDEHGLWSVGTVRFSNFGTLVSTVEAVVEASEAGYYASELENVVHVGVKAPLVKLVRDGRLLRERVVVGISIFRLRRRGAGTSWLHARSTRLSSRASVHSVRGCGSLPKNSRLRLCCSTASWTKSSVGCTRGSSR